MPCHHFALGENATGLVDPYLLEIEFGAWGLRRTWIILGSLKRIAAEVPHSRHQVLQRHCHPEAKPWDLVKIRGGFSVEEKSL